MKGHSAVSRIAKTVFKLYKQRRASQTETSALRAAPLGFAKDSSLRYMPSPPAESRSVTQTHPSTRYTFPWAPSLAALVCAFVLVALLKTSPSSSPGPRETVMTQLHDLDTPERPRTLRIGTLNIRYDYRSQHPVVSPLKSLVHGSDGRKWGEHRWQERRDQLVDQVLWEEPDVVGFQEVLDRQFEDLRELMGSEYGSVGVGASHIPSSYPRDLLLTSLQHRSRRRQESGRSRSDLLPPVIRLGLAVMSLRSHTDADFELLPARAYTSSRSRTSGYRRPLKFPGRRAGTPVNLACAQSLASPTDLRQHHQPSRISSWRTRTGTTEA